MGGKSHRNIYTEQHPPLRATKKDYVSIFLSSGFTGRRLISEREITKAAAELPSGSTLKDINNFLAPWRESTSNNSARLDPRFSEENMQNISTNSHTKPSNPDGIELSTNAQPRPCKGPYQNHAIGPYTHHSLGWQRAPNSKDDDEETRWTQIWTEE